VHVTVTHVTVTNPAVAGASKVASIVPRIISAGTPIPAPRIPLGMGSLSVEAEARDMRGRHKAAFVWARGADIVTSTPSASPRRLKPPWSPSKMTVPTYRFFVPIRRGENIFPGMGLGLAIAKEIIERRRGALAIENRKPSGLRQTLSFARQLAISPADASPTRAYS
jgi:hypothetical protein